MDQTTPETEVASLTEDQAAQEILSRWTKKQEPEAKQETAEPTEEVESQPEQAQADVQETEEASEAEPDDGVFEFDFGGEKVAVPKAFQEIGEKLSTKAKALVVGANQKFQEAAELRKAVDTEKAVVADIRKIAEVTADLLADHRSVSRRLQQLENVDIQNVDTDTLTRLNAEYNQLQAARGRIEQAYQAKVQETKAKEGEALRARMEHAEKVVSTRIKGWGPDLKKQLAEYAMGRGAPAQALESITEPWMVEILADAAYGRQMRDHKATVEKRVVQAQPVLKPGASAKQSPAAAKANEAVARAAKTGKVEDAAMALLARARARKR